MRALGYRDQTYRDSAPPVTWVGAVVFAAVLIGGCAIQSESPSQTYSSSGGACPNVASSQPMVVDVDPNATLTASPGAGVGVFAEYEAGGHWRLSWTCDTQLSGYACGYLVSVSVQSGEITNLDSRGLSGDGQATLSSPQRVVATTTTASSIDAMSFDASPGAAIELNVQLDGCYGAFFFFVQNGTVNGGYQGTLTDPLILQPLSP